LSSVVECIFSCAGSILTREQGVGDDEDVQAAGKARKTLHVTMKLLAIARQQKNAGSRDVLAQQRFRHVGQLYDGIRIFLNSICKKVIILIRHGRF